MVRLQQRIPKLIKLFNSLGILPFEMKGKSLVLSKFGCARFTIVLFVNVCSWLNMFYQTVQWNKLDPRILGPSVTYVSLAFVYSTILGTVHQLVSTKQRARLAKLVCTLESSCRIFPFSSSGASVFRSAHIKLQIIFLLIFSASNVKIILDKSDQQNFADFTYSAGWMFCQFYLNYLSLPFHCFLSVLEQNLVLLNRSILNAQTPNLISRAVLEYDSLAIGVERLNRFYGFTLLSSIAVQFLNVIASLFYTITTLTAANSMYEYCVNLSTSLTTAVYIYSLTKSCDSVVAKVCAPENLSKSQF
ncbi:Hypothetical protein NTJ_07565 [Nesidiocoris tenuis]|uniref:Gustatory receptor n=1 Tax=Nesidiocoris tenuis TaxID=355587 RepID=A0ABN7AV43_9HEMI|nr:Hypothetical protein NTJ_07565 [Nesidiocoris tenuis]